MISEIDILQFKLEIGKHYEIGFTNKRQRDKFSRLAGHRCKVITNYPYHILFERDGAFEKIRESVNKVDFLTNMMGYKRVGK